jgi:hypothetical protein
MASLRPDAKTCSPACSRNRERRGPRRVTGRPQGWSCAYCGCRRGEPEATRRRLPTAVQSGPAVLHAALRKGRLGVQEDDQTPREAPGCAVPRAIPVTTAGHWKCSECGISRAEAKRKRRGLGPRDTAAKTCSQECARGRERRLLREKYGAGSSYLYPMPEDWRCSQCGCTVERAHRNRVARQLAPLTSRHQTCSPECSRMLRVTPEREAQRAAREVWRIERAVRREVLARPVPGT